MSLDELKKDCAIAQKKGLHFILASIIIWIIVSLIHMSSLPILTKNLYTFFATAPLMPIAYIISKLIKVDFTHKTNPLTKLGLIFSLNQMLYLIIAMWVFSVKPENMVMILAIIFGAHLFPYSWLYDSISYKIMSILISVSIVIVGNMYNPLIVTLTMIIYEVIFSIMLILEMKHIFKNS